jgi:hypothetical protein
MTIIFILTTIKTFKLHLPKITLTLVVFWSRFRRGRLIFCQSFRNCKCNFGPAVSVTEMNFDTTWNDWQIRRNLLAIGPTCHVASEVDEEQGGRQINTKHVKWLKKGALFHGVRQWVSDSVSESVSQSGRQAVSQAVKQPGSHSVTQSVNQSVSQAGRQWVRQSLVLILHYKWALFGRYVGLITALRYIFINLYICL